jgi:hypothetical protein
VNAAEVQLDALLAGFFTNSTSLSGSISDAHAVSSHAHRYWTADDRSATRGSSTRLPSAVIVTGSRKTFPSLVSEVALDRARRGPVTGAIVIRTSGFQG